MMEDILREQANTLAKLKTATVFLGHKEEIRDQLAQAKTEMALITAGIDNMKHDLETMRVQNVKCNNLWTLLKKLDRKIVWIEENLHGEVLREFIQLNEEASPYVTKADKENCAPLSENQLVGRVKNLSVETPEPRIEDCKKTLFKNADDAYNMELLNAEEFAKIPKYMIGRQSLSTLNDFITTINQILEAKYSLLALGKNGARKKGKLDLYLSLKSAEIVVGHGEDPVYFFTAEDYHRHTQSKLDKAKLNLLTVLRHCKRLRELRVGKSLQYVVVSAWEGSRG